MLLVRSYTVRIYQETEDPSYRDALIGIVKDAHGQQCAFMGADELAQILSQDDGDCLMESPHGDVVSSDN